MFQYFKSNYMWSLAVNRILASGGQFGEIHWACKDLIDAATSGPRGDSEAWHIAWHKLSTQMERIACEAESKGHRVTAREHYLRACLYYAWAEAFLDPHDERAEPTYARHLGCFAKGSALSEPPVELIEIPFEGKVLYAYLVKPLDHQGPAPVVVLWTGVDGSKEDLHFVALALAARRIACLGVDCPGQGATLRLAGLKARHDSEVAAGVMVDYLETRPDIDPKRVGLMAASLGGYYAPRAVAYEKRFKACAAWGAVYDYHQVWVNRLKLQDGKHVINPQAPLGLTGAQLLNILGVKDYDEALRYLEPFKLRDVAPKISCDILIVHGEDDRQTSVAEARALFEAIPTNRKQLRVFTKEEGGASHVQTDRPEPALSLICDWFRERL